MMDLDIDAPKNIMTPYETDLFKLEPPAFLLRRFDDAMTIDES